MPPPPPLPCRNPLRFLSPLKPAAETLLSAREVVLRVEDIEGPAGVDAAAQHGVCLLLQGRRGGTKRRDKEGEVSLSPALGVLSPCRSGSPPTSPSVSGCS